MTFVKLTKQMWVSTKMWVSGNLRFEAPYWLEKRVSQGPDPTWGDGLGGVFVKNQKKGQNAFSHIFVGRLHRNWYLFGDRGVLKLTFVLLTPLKCPLFCYPRTRIMLLVMLSHCKLTFVLLSECNQTHFYFVSRAQPLKVTFVLLPGCLYIMQNAPQSKIPQNRCDEPGACVCVCVCVWVCVCVCVVAHKK